MDKQKVADAFNLWMDEYTNNPEAFDKTEAMAIAHLKEKLNGKPITYGQRCAEILSMYMERA